MINERLVWICRNKEWFDKDQNGFRRGKSCVDNLVKLISEIEISKQDNLNTIAVFLDVSSAYDNVNSEILIDKMQRMRCPYKITRYAGMDEKHRVTKFIIDDEIDKTREVNKGLLQRGVLSLVQPLYK